MAWGICSWHTYYQLSMVLTPQPTWALLRTVSTLLPPQLFSSYVHMKIKILIMATYERKALHHYHDPTITGAQSWKSLLACQSEYCWSSYQESKSSYLDSPASEVEINLWLHRQNINQQGFKSGGATVQPTSSTAVLLDYTVERKHEPWMAATV